MAVSWHDAVMFALDRFSERHATVQIERAKFIEEELSSMVLETNSAGNTPAQTVSRILQELRDEGVLFFSAAGRYVLNKKPIDASVEDFPDDVLVNAVTRENLRLDDVETSNEVGQARLRRGMSALRMATMQNYDCQCALCDIDDDKLLVTSHIARWADAPEARGKISNTICFCSFHDKLFEHGYFSLSDSLTILKKVHIRSAAINAWINEFTCTFRAPKIAPLEIYLAEHRRRVGL